MSSDQALSAANEPPVDLSVPMSMPVAHRALARLRREEPVHFSPRLGGWVLTRYDDIVSALSDPRLSAARMTGQIDSLPEAQRHELKPLRDCIAMWMGHTVVEDHLRMQKLFKRYFTPRTIDGLRPSTQQILDDILAPMMGRGHMELVQDLAYPFPARVIAVMLGVPAKDYDRFLTWSADIVKAFQPFHFERFLESQRGILAMTAYMKEVVDRHRAQIHQDLISVMIEALDSGVLLSEAEILANCSLLLFAGHETTANLIANGMALFLDHPDQLAKLRANPNLLPGAIEEMMRLHGPADVIARLALEDLEIGGRHIEKSQLVYLALSSGNRDESKFAEPHRFDIAREEAKRHLGFGMGSFYCLGAALARMEGQVCFGTLLNRLPNLRAAAPYVSQSGVPVNQRMISIPLAWDA